MARRPEKSRARGAEADGEDAEADGLERAADGRDDARRGEGDGGRTRGDDDETESDETEGDEADGDETEGDDDASEVEAGEGVSPLEEKARKIADRVLAELRWAGPIAVLAVALAAGRVFGPSMAALVLAGGALVGAITIFWASLRSLVGESELSAVDAYLLAVPAAEEEKKRAVLRSLKDIEFERSVGKLSDDDYRELSSKLREEAKRLLRAIDEGAEPRRKRALALTDKHLRAEGLRAPVPLRVREDGAGVVPEAPPTEVPEVEASAKASPKKRRNPRRDEAARGGAREAGAPAGARFCAECGAANDLDAAFCKRCGAKQAPGEATTSSSETE